VCRAKRAFNAVRLSSSESSPHMRTDCQHIIDSQTAWYQLQHAGPSRFDPEQECVGPGPISPFCSSGCLTASSLLAQHNSHLLITVTIAKLNPALKLAAHCSKTRTRATVKSTVSQITRFPFPPPFPQRDLRPRRETKNNGQPVCQRRSGIVRSTLSPLRVARRHTLAGKPEEQREAVSCSGTSRGRGNQGG
jgi:hypothetical protein